MKVSPPLPPAAEPQRRRVIPCAGSAYPGRASARSGFFFKAPDELVQAQRNGACRRAATTSATQHARVEGFAQMSVANAGRAILNSSAACSTPRFRARRREHARGATVTRTIHAPQAGPVGYGSQKPGDGAPLRPHQSWPWRWKGLTARPAEAQAVRLLSVLPPFFIRRSCSRRGLRRLPHDDATRRRSPLPRLQRRQRMARRLR